MTDWTKLSNFPSYEISRCGAVRRIDTGRVKSAVVAVVGYRVLNLWENGKGTVVYLHRLLAETFIGPCPVGHNVNHIDGDQLNNSLENLEYLPVGENSRDVWARQRAPRGERNGQAKITEAQALEIHRRANAGERTSVLAREFSLRPPVVSQIKKGDRWGHAIARANLR